MHEILEQRKSSNEVKNDLLGLLLQQREAETLSDEEILEETVMFYLVRFASFPTAKLLFFSIIYHGLWW